MEFHIDDPVLNIETGDRFIVSQICRGPSGLLYADGQGGWHHEKDLDFDRTTEQKMLMDEAERPHAQALAALKDFGAHLRKLRLAFGRNLPPEVHDWIFHLRLEMESIERKP